MNYQQALKQWRTYSCCDVNIYTCLIII